MIEKDCDNLKFSSNIKKIIKAVLNFFFYEKISHTLKALKVLKTLKAIKAPKVLKGTRHSGKSTKTQISE